MTESLFLSQASLSTFITCKRRFQLRYLERLPWPDNPLSPQQQMVIDRGRQFHQMLERYFLDLPSPDFEIMDEQVQRWWDNFKRGKPQIPPGKRLPEHRLTVPVGGHFLIGRFDLLIIGERSGRPFARLFDWKTSRPRPSAELQKDWQTRLYLAMLAESGQALIRDGQILDPDQIAITYWYAGARGESRTIDYDRRQHETNWADILNILTEIEKTFQMQTWPLTDNWGHCRTCLYQTYCNRQSAGQETWFLAEDDSLYDYAAEFLLEPDSP